MTKKSEKKAVQKFDAKIVNALMKSLKVDADAVSKLATLEHKLMTLKSEKKAKEQKSVRASMRNLTFYRHECDAETIAQLQKLAKSIR